jgi:alginate biosynthesis protein AlgX
MTLIVRFAAALGLLALATPAVAESQFGCSENQFSSIMPSVEGKDAVFFRTFADLRMQHPMDARVVKQLGDLAQVLRDNGTTLIYATIPSKSQAMPDFLPPDAAGYGYDPVIATAVYDDIITRLNAAGVLAPDLMRALQASPVDDHPFFRADFHWTSSGARLAAKAIGAAIKADPAYADVTPATYTSTAIGMTPAFSTMRRALQGFCIDALPTVETMGFKTTLQEETTADAGTLDIFGNAAGAAQIVLVGTSFSDSDVNNFAGFLQEYAGMEVINQAITGGNQFGAITSYLTSQDFAAQRPRFLIWENPIYNNLGQFGPGQLEELIAAVGDTCRVTLDTVADGNAGLVADLGNHVLGPEDAIFADFGAESARSVTFTLDGPGGLTRRATVDRGDRLRATGRFYLGLSAFNVPGLHRVHVTFDRPIVDGAKITLCLNEKGDAS